MTVRIRTVDYEDAGVALSGEFAWDDAWTGPRPCVVIVHDAMKSLEHFEDGRAAALAGPVWPLRATVFALGFGNGVFAISAIAAMMGLVGEGRATRAGVRAARFVRRGVAARVRRSSP